MAYFILTISMLCICNSVNGFNLGITETKCSHLGDNSDPCDIMYGAICDGSYCKCSLGTFEDKTMKRCRKRNANLGSFEPKKSLGFDDLPYDYNPTTTKHKPIVFPDNPPIGWSDTNGRNANNTGRTHLNPDSIHNPNPGLNQSGYNPNKVGYPAGTKTNTSGTYPTRIESYGGHGHDRNKYHNHHTGRNTGGGIGGGLSLLILIVLIYFCCCRGEKGRNLRGRLPFGSTVITTNQPGVTYTTQQNPLQQPPQPIYMAPPAGTPMYVQQQPGSVYVQQPGPVYVQQPGQIYPPQQPTQVYPPAQAGANVYYPPQQPQVPPQVGKEQIPQQPPGIGFGSPPPPYTVEYTATAPPPTG